MNKLPEIHCTVQYLSDRLPFVAQGAIVDTYGSMDMSMDVEGIFLYSKDEPRPKPSCVYLCRPEHLDGLGTAYQDAVMICINNGEPMAHVPPGYGGLMVRCSQSLEFIFNGLQKVLVGLKKSNGLLDRAILEEMSIPDIVSIAEQNFINPFLLFDANFELLGWSRSHPCSDPLFLETVGEKQLPQKYMVRLIRRGTLRKLNASGTVVLAGEEGLDRSTVVMVMLKRDGLVIGYGMLICCQQEARRAMIRGFEEFASKLKARLEEAMSVPQDTGSVSCRIQNTSITVNYTSYEPVDPCVLPQGAKEAAAQAQRLQEGNPDNGDGTYTLQESGFYVNVATPEGYTLKDTNYDEVDFYSEELDRLVRYQVFLTQDSNDFYFWDMVSEQEYLYAGESYTSGRMEYDIVDAGSFSYCLDGYTYQGDYLGGNYYAWSHLDDTFYGWIVVSIYDGGEKRDSTITREEIQGLLEQVSPYQLPEAGTEVEDILDKLEL